MQISTRRADFVLQLQLCGGFRCNAGGDAAVGGYAKLLIWLKTVPHCFESGRWKLKARHSTPGQTRLSALG